MDKDTRKSTFIQLFKPISNEKFLEQVKQLEVDKYAKKLTADKLITMLAIAQLEQHRGLREISNSLNKDDLSKELELESISASQLSRKLKDLPSELIQSLFEGIVTRLGSEVGFNSVRHGLGRIYLIDSSTISLCLSQYRWAEFRKTKSGIKLHLRLRLFDQGVLPDSAKITPAKRSDRTQMDEMVVEGEDVLNVFDRGYLDYKKFNSYCENGTRFVSRLKNNALVEIIEEYSIPPGSLIKKDQKVLLGKDGTTKMKHPLRLVETEDTEGNPVIIVTNDFKLSAEEISDIYRCRWKIELFFKWIKQHFHIKHFYGLSQQAVENQVFIALITYCLLVLIKLKTSYEGQLLTINRMILTCLYEPFTLFVQKLYRKPIRSSKGRRKNTINHDAVYQDTLKQVIEGEADYLNDLTYDPLTV